MLSRALPAASRRAPHIVAGLSAAAVVVALAACGSSESSNTSNGNGNNGGSSGGESVSLTAMDFSFTPAQLSIKGGDTVTVSFKNSGQTEHSFTLDNGNATVDADAGETKTVTFTAPSSGTLAFHCKYHPTQMKGTISIGGSGAAGSNNGSGASSSDVPGY
jgi:plastocyanin